MSSYNNCAVVTYLYPKAKKYFSELLSSIRDQTYNEFDLIVFSDGVLEAEIDWQDLKHLFVPIAGSIIEIRINSLSILKETNYDGFIFADADDTMSSNRVHYSINLLNTYYLICNDLNVIDEDGNLKEQCIWKNRLKDGFEFNAEFLVDKNIVGFGNTALRKELLVFNIKLTSNSILAADWYVFYLLLKYSGQTACFSSSLQTNYRQHEFNDAGIRSLSAQRLEYVFKVKELHYNALLSGNYTEILKVKTSTDKITNMKYIDKIDSQLPQHFFWWEETNYIKD